MKILQLLRHTRHALQPLALAVAVSAGLLASNAQAATTTSVISFSNLSISPGQKISEITKGALPSGSILRSVSINANHVSGWAYTNEICVWIADSSASANGILRIVDQADYNAPAAATTVGWNWSGSGYDNPIIATQSTLPAIDLHNYAVFLDCDYESIWSGTITLTYDVPQDPNTTKDITAFTSTYGAADIAGTNISFLVPTGSSVTALAPTFTHNGASASPASGTARDFTTPQTYTITAVNGGTQTYTVTATPWDKASGVALWLDASQLTGLSDGQQVGTWTDMSASTNHAARQNGSSSGYPKYVASGPNSKPVIRFNSGNSNTGDYFKFTRISNIRSVFWVLKENAGASDGHFLLGDDNNYDFHRQSANGHIWDSSNANSNVRNGVTKLMGSPIDGTTTSLPAGQFQLVSLVTSGDVRANQITQDRTYHGSWQGDIAEILIYTTPLTANQEAIVGSYLSAKYGLTTAYPVAAVAPAAPSDLAATALDSAVSLSWTASSGATGYNVKRSTTSGSGYSTIGTTTTATTYSDSTATNGTTYYYVVTATSSGGESANSTGTSAAPVAASTSTITSLATSGTPSSYGGSVTLTATVTPTPSGGTVQFYDNAVALGSPVTVNSGHAQLVTSSLTVGSHPITATYSGSSGYAGSSASSMSQVVNKASSTVAVTGTTSFTYSGAAQGPNSVSTSGSTGAVTYSYAGASGTSYGASSTRPINVGSYTVTATLAADTNYNSATSSATDFVIGQATPSISTAPTATALTYGQTLASSTLSGGAASVAGGFAWTTSSTAPPVGTTDYGVTFTPSDTANYTIATTTASVTVGKITPSITTSPTATALTSGQTLASSTLSGGAASVAGSFAWTTPTTAPSVGTAAQGVTFTPSDTTHYATASTTVSVTVHKASSTALVASANPSTHGNSVVFTATVQTPAPAAPSTVTIFSQNFGSEATDNYNTSGFTFDSGLPQGGQVGGVNSWRWWGAGLININGSDLATNGKKWAVGHYVMNLTVVDPGDQWGDAPTLSMVSIAANAGFSDIMTVVSGTSGDVTTANNAYTTTGGTPASTADYPYHQDGVAGTHAVSYILAFDVAADNPLINTYMGIKFDNSNNSAISNLKLDFTGSGSGSGGPITASDASGNCVFSVDGTVVATHAVTNGVATYTSSSSLAAGDHTILASYVGDSTYAASSLSLTQTVNQVTPVVTWSNPADITYGTALSGTQLNATSGGVAGTFAYTPASDTVLNAGTSQTLSVQFTPTDTTNFATPSATTVAINVGKASQSISFSPAASVAKLDGSLTLAGTASSGLAVSYASSAPAIASVSGSTLTLHQGGSVTLTASQTGGANYTAATAVARTLNITGFAAMDDAVSRAANSSGIKIPVASLLANDGQMSSNGTVTAGTGLTITGVTAGSGNSVRVSGAFVFFTPSDLTASAATSFTYSVSDGSSTATATVTVSTVDATPFSLSLLRVVTPAAFNGTSTSVTVEFAGVPSQTYQIEYSTGLNIWSAPQAVATGSTGTFEATFTKDGNQLPAWNSLFFRASR